MKWLMYFQRAHKEFSLTKYRQCQTICVHVNEFSNMTSFMVYSTALTFEQQSHQALDEERIMEICIEKV